MLKSFKIAIFTKSSVCLSNCKNKFIFDNIIFKKKLLLTFFKLFGLIIFFNNNFSNNTSKSSEYGIKKFSK